MQIISVIMIMAIYCNFGTDNFNKNKFQNNNFANASSGYTIYIYIICKFQ